MKNKKLFLALALGTAAAMAAPYEAQAFCAAGDRYCMGQSAGSASGGAFSSGLGYAQGVNNTGGGSGVVLSALTPNAISYAKTLVYNFQGSAASRAGQIIQYLTKSANISQADKQFINMDTDLAAEEVELAIEPILNSSGFMFTVGAAFTNLIWRISVPWYSTSMPRRAM